MWPYMIYSKHQDCLIALVSHLGLTVKKSRTAPFIAESIGIPKEDVRNVLGVFPGIFRRSKNTSKASEHFYTLQIRYALRGSQYDESTGDEEGIPLEIADVMSLLAFIARQAHQEQDVSVANTQMQQTRELTQKELQLSKESMEKSLSVAKAEIVQSRNTAWLSLGASLIAAIAAIVAAVYAAN